MKQLLLIAVLAGSLAGCGKVGVGGVFNQAVGNWAEVQLPQGCRPKLLAASNDTTAIASVRTAGCSTEEAAMRLFDVDDFDPSPRLVSGEDMLAAIVVSTLAVAIYAGPAALLCFIWLAIF